MSRETRLNKKERGWYKDPDPSFHDMKEKFNEAARRNGEKAVEQVKAAAIRYVLGKFALLDEHGDPVGDLTDILKNDDFGYTKRTSKNNFRMRDEKPVWGPPAGLGSGWTADYLGAQENETYGGV